MNPRRRPLLAPAALALASAVCSDSARPSAPSTPVDAIRLVAFVDENRNGALDTAERMRIPGADVTFGAASARTAPLTGEARIEVQRGRYTLFVRPGSLPPYLEAPPTAEHGPLGSDETLPVPLTLPRRGGSADVFLAFGDSITFGNPEVGDGESYRAMLEARLRQWFGAGRVVNEGLNSSDSQAGAHRLEALLEHYRPGFVLILYGTNDWNHPVCRTADCFTAGNVESMIRTARGTGVEPFVATILPTNVGWDDRATHSRNDWVATQNEAIRAVSRREGAVLVDLFEAFERSPLGYRKLFVDHVHPSADGYDLMARTWFEAISGPRSPGP